MSRLATIGGRLYRGEVSVDFVGRQRLWYAISGAILVVSIVSLATLGLKLGVDFKGGSTFQFTKPGVSTAQVRSAVTGSGVVKGETTVQSVGTGLKPTGWRVQTAYLSSTDAAKVQSTIAQKFGLKSADEVAIQTVGPSWGADVSSKAFQGLVIFLALVVLYLWVTFEAKMALSAIVALAHDILITIGIYSLLQFEVTPSSVVGLLTILGYSLYDTVVVFDKVRENTRGLGPGSDRTYSQAANLAVNQTLVRSINTSIFALLPVAGLLFIGAGLLKAGTLKDLSLVLFVGMLAGTYSSICIATPLLADLKEREPKMKELRTRLAARDSRAKRQPKAAAKPGTTAKLGKSAGSGGGTRAGTAVADADEATEVVDTEATGTGDEADGSAGGGAKRKMVQQGGRLQPQRGTRRTRKK